MLVKITPAIGRLKVVRSSKRFYLIVALLTVVCSAIAFIGMRGALNFALTKEANSRGMDWAHHLETRLTSLQSMMVSEDSDTLNSLPLPSEFENLLRDIFAIGHIFQVDYINVACQCEVSVGSYRQSMPGGHEDHASPSHQDRGVSAVFKNVGQVQSSDPGRFVTNGVSKEHYRHGAVQANVHASDQVPIDQEILSSVISNASDQIIIRSGDGKNMPKTYAKVYHLHFVGSEVAYVLRVLVDLEDQAQRYVQFLLVATGCSLLLLLLAVGYPTRRYVLTLRQQREADQRASFLAHHDVLTNLNNRNNFQETVSDMLWRCYERKQSALMFLFDLNGFKEVNDFYGHQIGDKLLCEFASLLTRMVPQGGYVARLGGDEFVVVIGDIPSSEVNYRDYLDLPLKLRMPINGGRQTVKASIAGGVVQYPRDADTTSKLVQAADLALYAAKPNRSGEIREYTPMMKKDFYERLNLHEDFREALVLSQIEPYYQPIVNIQTGAVEGFEALARWNHPEKGVLSPAVFGDVFQDTEISALLGAQMLSKIVDHMAHWKEIGADFQKIGLNAATGDLLREDFAGNILAQLAMRGLKPNELVVEVTENCLFGVNKAAFLEQLNTFRNAGCYIALDDFGTGFSSITQLKELPLTAVKIDKSFVENVLESEADQSIVRALLDLGASMKFKVVLEGVETSEQLEFLKGMGFDLAQGFYFSYPIAAAEVPAFLQQGNFDVSQDFVKFNRR